MPSLVLRGGRVFAATASAALVLAGLTLTASEASAFAPVVLGCLDTSPVPGYTVVNLTYTGTPETVNIPAGVSAVSIDICGAKGGDASFFSSTLGGLGGETLSTVPLTGATALSVVLGESPGLGVPRRTFGGGGAGANGGSSP